MPEVAAKIDSQKAATVPGLAQYAGRNAAGLPAVVVRCKSAFDNPGSNKRAEAAFDFVISPDASVCYSKTRTS